MKTIVKYLFFATLLSCFASCNGTDIICGSWVEPVAGQAGKVQGVELRSDGTAASIGMATLLYERWQRNDNELVLTGKSIGNGLTFEFSDTLRIERLTADSLILASDGYRLSLGRQK